MSTPSQADAIDHDNTCKTVHLLLFQVDCGHRTMDKSGRKMSTSKPSNLFRDITFGKHVINSVSCATRGPSVCKMPFYAMPPNMVGPYCSFIFLNGHNITARLLLEGFRHKKDSHCTPSFGAVRLMQTQPPDSRFWEFTIIADRRNLKDLQLQYGHPLRGREFIAASHSCPSLHNHQTFLAEPRVTSSGFKPSFFAGCHCASNSGISETYFFPSGN